MSQPKVAIAITADDKTARGAKSAEKRLGAIPKHSSSVVRRGLGDLSRQGRSTIRTIGAVEQAGARVFGNASITSGFASRLGGIRAAAAAAGTGLGEAAAGGSMLSTTLGVVGTAAGATIGILGAAAYAAFKMTSSWATGAASIGRTAATIGIGTDALQKFTAAAERAGVDKGTSIGALGGLSESLNGAAYGTNGEARAVLTKMGVKIERNKDGTANVEAMLPAIADAISRYNPYAQRVAAGALGIPDAALAAFRQGGKALSAEMKDAGDTAYVATPSDIKKAQRIDRKGTLVSQMKDKGLGLAGAGVADATEKGYDLALAGGRQLVSGATDFGGVVKNSFAPASAAVERGGRAIERAAKGIGEAIVGASGGRGRFTGKQITALARRAVPIAAEARRYGFSKAEAQGIAANIVLESGGNHRAREKGGAGRGLIQWTDPARKAEFRRVMGVNVEHASRDQQWRFLRYELSHKEASGWKKAMSRGQDAAAIAAGYAWHVERPKEKARDSAERAAVASAMQEIPVKVEIDLRGALPGTRAKVTAGRKAPAVSHAFSHAH